MRNYRLGYAGGFLVSLVFFWMTGSLFLLLFCAMLLLLPVFLLLLLKLESRGIAVEWECRPACRIGQQFTVRFLASHKTPVIAAGMVKIALKDHNVLLDEERQRQITLSLSKRQVQFDLTLDAEKCGEVHLICESMVLYDIFGLCRVPIKTPGEKMVTVYPEELPLQLFPGKMSRGMLEGEQVSQTRKGSDQSEVFDLREYYPGDDVRSIHWKLSSKMDTMMVREASDTSRFDTMVLFDAGLRTGEQVWDRQLLSDCVRLGMTVSLRLEHLSISHCVAMLAGGALQMFQVSDYAQHERMVNIWMGLSLQQESGTGLRYWQVHARQYHFTKILYVTIGNCPDDVFRLPEGTDMTAICLQEHGDEITMTEKGMCHVINLPVSMIRENVLSINF